MKFISLVKAYKSLVLLPVYVYKPIGLIVIADFLLNTFFSSVSLSLELILTT